MIADSNANVGVGFVLRADDCRIVPDGRFGVCPGRFVSDDVTFSECRWSTAPDDRNSIRTRVVVVLAVVEFGRHRDPNDETMMLLRPALLHGLVRQSRRGRTAALRASNRPSGTTSLEEFL